MPSGAIPYPFGDCRVCGDHATGVHYGVATCEGCKNSGTRKWTLALSFLESGGKWYKTIKHSGFYKRSLAKAYKYRCFHGGKCSISPLERNRCKSCRYQRCVMSGMSVDGVKMGRIPKVDKERALEEHYGCGSREILSSGIVIPAPNKRHGKDQQNRDGSKDEADMSPSNGETSGYTDIDVSGRSHASHRYHDPSDAYRQNLLAEAYARRSETISRNLLEVDMMDDIQRLPLEGRIKIENVDPTTDPSLPMGLGVDGRSYRERTALASAQNSASSSYIRDRGPGPDESFGHQHGLNMGDESYVNSAMSHCLASQSRMGPSRNEVGACPRFSDSVQDWRYGIPGRNGEPGISNRAYTISETDFRPRGPYSGNSSSGMDYLKRGPAGQGSQMGSENGGPFGLEKRTLSVGSRNKYSPSMPPGRECPEASTSRISGRCSVGEEGTRGSMDDHLINRPRSNDNGLSPFYPPVIKELIAQVIDSGKDMRELKHTLVKQLMSTANSHTLTSSLSSSPSSTLPQQPYSTASLSPASTASAQSAASVGSSGGNNWVTRTPPPSGVDFGEDSKLMRDDEGEEGGGEGDEWGNPGDGTWRIRGRKRTLDGSRAGDLDDDIKDGVPLKRSHSSGDMDSSKESMLNSCGMEHKLRLGETDYSEYVSEELSLAGQSELICFEELMRRDKIHRKGDEEKASFELEHLMVEAGQRGRLRDAVDRICEDMSQGDVPILNLDSNAITVNGEPQPVVDLESEPTQSGLSVEEEKCEDKLTTGGGLVGCDGVVIKQEIEEDGEMKTFQDGDSKEKQNINKESLESEVICIDTRQMMRDAAIQPMTMESFTNQAKLCMKQGYLAAAAKASAQKAESSGSQAVVKFDPDMDAGNGDEEDPEKRGVLMRRVLRCIKVFADKVMHLIEIEIGIAVDEATGRRPLHRLNDPKTLITQEEICVFWNDFMLTLPRGNSVIMGLCANIPGFKQLNVNDQLTLIEQAYYMLWMILYSRLFWDGECHIRINCEAVYSRGWYNRFFPESLVDSMFSFSEEINKCQLTPSELIILCALQLTIVDGVKLENPGRVQRLHDYYLDLLAYEIEKSHVTNHSRVLIKIFQLLPLLTPMNQQQLEVVDTFCVDQPPSESLF